MSESESNLDKFLKGKFDEWENGYLENALGLIVEIKAPFSRTQGDFTTQMAQFWATLHLAKTLEDASKRIEEKLDKSNLLSAELVNAYKVIADYQADIQMTLSSSETSELMEDEFQKLRNLYEACMSADAAGELDERITGKILDEAGKALGIKR
jgi:hypothetical protein